MRGRVLECHNTTAALAVAAALVASSALASHPSPPLSLTQQDGDGSALATGGTTSEGPEVRLLASSS